MNSRSFIHSIAFATIAVLMVVFVPGRSAFWALVPAALAFVLLVDVVLDRWDRHTLPLPGFAAVTMLAVILAPAFAYAADTTVAIGGAVGSIEGVVLTIMAVLIAGIIGWLCYLLKTKFGLEIEAKHREALETTLMNAVHAGLDMVASKAAGAKVDVKSAAVASAMNYAISFAPDAIKYFGLTNASLQAKLSAKLTQVLGVPDTVVAAIAPVPAPAAAA